MDNELYFKTGIKGRLARFFDKRRSRGDPYEATLVLPAVLIISALRLNEVHKVSDLVATVVLVAASLGAGAWMGACLGMERGLRALMRGLSAGAIEGAALPALNDTLDRHQALANASALIYLSMTFYWIGHLVLAILGDIATLSEEQWQEGVPRRAWLSSVFWLALRNARLDDVPHGTVIAVRLLKILSQIGF